jgi:hypothetical protein
MVQQHLQVHLKTYLNQVLLEQADGPKRCARASRIADLSTRKNRRVQVIKRDVQVIKRRKMTFTCHELINKRRVQTNTRRVLVSNAAR